MLQEEWWLQPSSRVFTEPPVKGTPQSYSVSSECSSIFIILPFKIVFIFDDAYKKYNIRTFWRYRDMWEQQQQQCDIIHFSKWARVHSLFDVSPWQGRSEHQGTGRCFEYVLQFLRINRIFYSTLSPFISWVTESHQQWNKAVPPSMTEVRFRALKDTNSGKNPHSVFIVKDSTTLLTTK